jgi:hypothetical protein
VTLQILNYEFLGPIRLSEWGPPMDEVLFLMLKRTKDTFEIIYAGESDKTNETDFFTKNEDFKCWIQNAGSESDLYLSIYPMWNSQPDQRKRLVQKIISRYNPICNKKEGAN